jgi:hypothetical protein
VSSEVGLLTRNIVIQGDSTSLENEYGAHIMISNTADADEQTIARIQYAEFREVGQAASLYRYPINFFMLGKIPDSKVVGCSIHHSYNRALTIHGSHHLHVEDNVAFNIWGHAYFLEDGIETKNVFKHNLGVKTIRTFGMLVTDQFPATFWISNPDNTYIGNHAAHSDHSGFWYQLDEHPTQMSEIDSVCPRGVPLGKFENNLAHGCWKYGLRVYPEYIPRRFPCQENDPKG